MRAKLFAAAITAASFGYLLISLGRVQQFLETGIWLGLAFAAAIVGVVVVSAILIVREIRFGQSMAAMAGDLENSGELPADDMPRTAAGRIERDAADQRFEEYKSAVELDDKSWQNWYRLAIAYDDARDRRRARAAMRTAERLFRAN